MTLTKEEYVQICDILNYVKCRNLDIDGEIVVGRTLRTRTDEEIFEYIRSQCGSIERSLDKIYEMLPEMDLE